MAFCGLLLPGGIGIPPPMQHAVRGVLAGFAAVLWYCGVARWIAALFSRPDRGGVGAPGPVGYDAAANRIDRPRDAAGQGA